MSGEPYDVGYKKPPKHSRFEKGRSGNPVGRPKKKRSSLGQILIEALAETVEVTVRGRVHHVSYKKLIVLRLGEMAAKGNWRAFKLLLDLRDYIEETGELEPKVFWCAPGEDCVL